MQLVLDCNHSTLSICSVSDAQLVKVICLNASDGMFACVGVMADGHRATCIEHGLNQNQANHHVHLWDVHRDGSAFEEVCICQEGENVSKIAFSPLDDSIAIMRRTGIVKLAHRLARDTSWTVKVVAGGKCFHMTGKMSFSTSSQLLATAHADRGVEIWDPVKGECVRTIVCNQLSMLHFLPDGSLLAARTSLDHCLCLPNG
jgi:WD40 repeat protein